MSGHVPSGNIGKEAAIERLCALVTSVAKDKGDIAEPYDCFCGSDMNQEGPPRVAEKFVAYIEASVHRCLHQERPR